eukprot:scaffold4518_cov410-Prasinococcus_capsulatus_cf.AAC.34
MTCDARGRQAQAVERRGERRRGARGRESIGRARYGRPGLGEYLRVGCDALPPPQAKVSRSAALVAGPTRRSGRASLALPRRAPPCQPRSTLERNRAGRKRARPALWRKLHPGRMASLLRTVQKHYDMLLERVPGGCRLHRDLCGVLHPQVVRTSFLHTPIQGVLAAVVG